MRTLSRLRLRLRPRLSGPRYSTTNAAEVTTNKETITGKISKEPKEILLYYNRLFVPLGQFGRIVPWWVYRPSNQTVLNKITNNLPKDLDLKVKEFIPRDREGGAFVKLSVQDWELSTTQAQREIKDHIEKLHSRFNLLSGNWQVFEVRGRPWIEDMRRRFTTTITVSYDGPDVPPEELYANLRRYGRIQDITPPAPGSKDLPRSALVEYTNFHDATTARNCANGLKIGDTTVHISFHLVNRGNKIRDWISDHPRIAIPILIALLAGLAYFIFEPIRMLSIKTKIRGTLDIDRYPVLKSLGEKVRSGLSFMRQYVYPLGSSVSQDAGIHAPHHEMAKASDELKQLFNEGTDTFIVVSGPKGAGKMRLVNSASGKRPFLVIDGERIEKLKSDREMLAALSSSIGYRPVFLFMNSLSRFIDLAAQSLSGQSSGISETTEQQIQRMLHTASRAVHSVAVANMPSGIKESDYLERHTDSKPIIVIKGCSSGDSLIARNLCHWVGSLVVANTAQVVFVTQDLSHDKLLTEALPNRLFKTLSITDASPEIAKEYILNYAKPANVKSSDEKPYASLSSQARASLGELMGLPVMCIAPLGGRLADLQAFTRRLVAGEQPLVAIESMVRQSALEITQMFLKSSTSEFSVEQAWVIISRLAELERHSDWLTITGDLGTHPLFSTQEQLQALRALEYKELISVRVVGGRIVGVRPSKPLYHSAFRDLTNDKVMSYTMNVGVLKALAKIESAKIADFEKELHLLAQLPKRWETNARVENLCAKFAASQLKINECEKSVAEQQRELVRMPPGAFN